LRRRSYALIDEAQEQLSAMLGQPAVEAEEELVEVMRQGV
jgi:hypothetical protein